MSRLQPLNVLGLVVVWTLLWGSVSVGTVLVGLAVACAVSAAFPLPGGRAPERVHPWYALRFGAWLARDLVTASAGVALVVLRDGPRTRSSVVRVQLRSRSELLIAGTAATLSLVPGTMIVELDRTEGILFVHCLGVDDPEGIERARAETLEVEARVIRAFGTREDLERLS